MLNRYSYMSLLAAGTIGLAGCGNNSSDQSAVQAPTSAATPAAAQAVAEVKTLAKSDLDAAKPAGHCSLDEVDNTALSGSDLPITVKPGQTIFAGGWTVTSTLKAPPAFTLILQSPDNSYGFDVATSVSRPDVAKAVNANTASMSGFNVAANLGTIPAGTYKVFALMKDEASTEMCDLKHQIVIGG